MRWEKGFLSESNPQSLLDTMLHLYGVHFVLHSGQEHHSLRLSHFEVLVNKDDMLALSIPKTHQGTS